MHIRTISKAQTSEVLEDQWDRRAGPIEQGPRLEDIEPPQPALHEQEGVVEASGAPDSRRTADLVDEIIESIQRDDPSFSKLSLGG